MKCRYPICVEVKGHYIYVPCGHCAWCLSRKRDEWVFRMKEEAKEHLYNYFVTFTYRDQDLPININEETGEIVQSVNKSHISEFNRGLRRKGNRFRFLVCSEYGPKTLRPHYHGIYFCDQKIDLESAWPYGDENVQLPAGEGSYKYVTKYILKGSKIPEGAAANFLACSRRPGIGRKFALYENSAGEKVMTYKGNDYILTPGGVKCPTPRYYKRLYQNSLDEKLRNFLSEVKLEELENVVPWRDLEKKWEKSCPHMSFEEWLSQVYKKDFNSQICINSKSNG